MISRFKFRIWNKETNCFVSAYENEAGENKLKYFIDANGNLGKLIYGLVEGVSEDNIVYPESYAIQQYTGLRDRNNVEIYEGDIVRDVWEENYPYGYSPNEWESCNEIFIVRYEAPSFIFPDRGGSQICIENHTWEVVGNIFETPELIK